MVGFQAQKWSQNESVDFYFTWALEPWVGTLLYVVSDFAGLKNFKMLFSCELRYFKQNKNRFRHGQIRLKTPV